MLQNTIHTLQNAIKNYIYYKVLIQPRAIISRPTLEQKPAHRILRYSLVLTTLETRRKLQECTD